MTFFAGIKPIEEDEDIKAIRAGATPPRPPTNNELASLVEQIVAQSQQPVDSSPPGKLGFGKRLALAALGTASPSAQSQVVNPLIAARTPDAQQGRERAAQQQEFQNAIMGAEAQRSLEQLRLGEQQLDVQRQAQHLRGIEVSTKLAQHNLAVQEYADGIAERNAMGMGTLQAMSENPQLTEQMELNTQAAITEAAKYAIEFSKPEVAAAAVVLDGSMKRLKGMLVKQKDALSQMFAAGPPGPEGSAPIGAPISVESQQQMEEGIQDAFKSFLESSKALEAATDPDFTGSAQLPPHALTKDIGEIEVTLQGINAGRQALDAAIAAGFFPDDAWSRQWDKLLNKITSGAILDEKQIRAAGELEGLTASARNAIYGAAVTALELKRSNTAIPPDIIGGDPRAIKVFLERSWRDNMIRLNAINRDPRMSGQVQDVLRGLGLAGDGAPTSIPPPQAGGPVIMPMDDGMFMVKLPDGTYDKFPSEEAAADAYAAGGAGGQ